jgi:hypothetical protein
VTVAHLTDTNYCNILKNNFEPLEAFRVQFGQIAYTALMYLGSIAGGIAGLLLYIGIKKLINIKNTKE